MYVRVDLSRRREYVTPDHAAYIRVLIRYFYISGVGRIDAPGSGFLTSEAKLCSSFSIGRPGDS